MSGGDGRSVRVVGKPARVKPLATKGPGRGLVGRCSSWLGRKVLPTARSMEAPPAPASRVPPAQAPRGRLVPWAAVAAVYTDHFLHTHHYNLAGRDQLLGPVILSITFPSTPHSSLLLLRLTYGCFLMEVEGTAPHSALTLAKLVCPALSITSLAPLLEPDTSRLLATAHLGTLALYNRLLGELVPPHTPRRVTRSSTSTCCLSSPTSPPSSSCYYFFGNSPSLPTIPSLPSHHLWSLTPPTLSYLTYPPSSLKMSSTSKPLTKSSLMTSEEASVELLSTAKETNVVTRLAKDLPVEENEEEMEKEVQQLREEASAMKMATSLLWKEVEKLRGREVAMMEKVEEQRRLKASLEVISSEMVEGQ